MYFIGNPNSNFESLIVRLSRLSSALFTQLPQAKNVLEIKPGDNQLSNLNSDYLMVVKSGQIKASKNGRSIFYLQELDLIGLSNAYQLPQLDLSCEDEVVVDLYDANEVLNFMFENKERQSMWTSYLVTKLVLFSQAYAQVCAEQSSPNAGFLHFNRGDIIIREGDKANEVYSLLSGAADVSINGVKVGEVLKDEIFGAMAVFTDEPRTATVTASENNCSILAVPKDEFVNLIASQPQTTMTLVRDMARKINSLNEKLVANSQDSLKDFI